MQTPCLREPIRLGIQAKVAVASPEHAPALLTALMQHERECLALAGDISPASARFGSWRALCRDCVREGVLAQLAAEMDWAARTRRRIVGADPANEAERDRNTSIRKRATRSPC